MPSESEKQVQDEAEADITALLAEYEHLGTRELMKLAWDFGWAAGFSFRELVKTPAKKKTRPIEDVSLPENGEDVQPGKPV